MTETAHRLASVGGLALGAPPPGTSPVLVLVIVLPILAITAVVIGVAMRRRGRSD